LILRKIIKIVATRCCPRPRWGSLQRSPDSLAGFKRPTSKGREGVGRGERGEGRGKEKGKGRGRGSEGKAFPLL